MSDYILPMCITKNYVTTSLKNRIKEVFGLFEYLKLVDNEIELPKITANYKVMYSQRLTNIKSSKVENYVVKKIMQEIRKSNRYQQEFLTKVTLSLKKLTELEMKVFKLSVYDNYSDEDIGEELGYCIDNIRIIKKSSFIKFLVSLGADYDCYN